MKPTGPRDIRWVEGLRGISAATIVTSHLFPSFNPMLRAASMTDDTPPTFLQLPVVRLIFSGRASLSFFFLLTGFVNSLGFLKQVRSGNQNAALQRLAKSAYRRIGRLVLPATVATTVSWVLCQLGAYRLAREGDVNWFRDISPRQSPDLASGLWDLLRNLFKTWSEASNDYDKVQWNLFFLLKASMVVYMLLLMTTYLTPRSRKICILIYYMYGWTSGDSLITMNVSAGMFLAEVLFDQTESEEKESEPPSSWKLWPTLLLATGLVIAGYPEDHTDWTAWSLFLQNLGETLFRDVPELSRKWGSVGGSFIILGVMYLPAVQHALSHRYLVWMGKVSFSVFLIHSFLIRSVLCWMLFWNSEAPEWEEEDGTVMVGRLPHVRGFSCAVIIGIFFVVVYYFAHLWTLHVESRCAQVVQWIEDRMSSEDPHFRGATNPV